MANTKRAVLYLFFGIVLLCVLAFFSEANAVEKTFSVTELEPLGVTASTYAKPQSKLWFHDGQWWAVLPDATGTWVWRLAETKWVMVLKLSDATEVYADVRTVNEVVYVLLFKGKKSEFVTLAYDGNAHCYQFSPKYPSSVPLHLDKGVETATLDVDASGRVWVASDAKRRIRVRWRDASSTDFHAPITLERGISKDDICVVMAFPQGDVGVLWSNQVTQHFGFRLHKKGNPPQDWEADESPAAAFALSVGKGMADDHMNCAVGTDGALYAAVKTSYDVAGQPKLVLLVRRPSGTWEEPYCIDTCGTRPALLLDEQAKLLIVTYASQEGGGNIGYKCSSLTPITFGERHVVLSDVLDNVTSTKQPVQGEAVLVASTPGLVKGVHLHWH